jgi:hypothetical protein
MFVKSQMQSVSLPLALIVLAACAAPAAAQDRPFFVDANVGRVSIDDLDGIPLHKSTTAFRLGTGYRFLPWLGVAGAYVDLGTIDSTIDIGIGTPQAIAASADGFEVTLTGFVPLTDALALTAHVGVLWWTGDTSVAGTVSSDSGNDSTWGIGAEYAFGPTIAATAGWRRYAVDSVDADALWLGVMLRFGDAP